MVVYMKQTKMSNTIYLWNALLILEIEATMYYVDLCTQIWYDHNKLAYV